MRIAKLALLLVACMAIVASVAPLAAQPGIEDKDPGGGGDGGTNAWTVVCEYDGQERLQKKTCTSGGAKSCNCP